MSIITAIAALALAALLIWTIGAPITRIGGALLTIASLLCIVLGDSIATRAPLLIAGVALWLAGHFLTAYKTRTWSSRLAENIVTRTPLRNLDPVSGREHRQARRAATGDTPKPSTGRTQAPVDDFAQWERELATAAPAPTGRPVAKRVPARSATPSRSAVYGTRAAKAAGNLAVRTVPGARAARSAWRFVR
ncbi:hypothetical protein [Rhodococcus artemisiae]|uniref:Transmembrane protein n=1 Tax=Rhodococcus artemisiae TaxID=714159 RepID=A0ABU7LLW8_9NOCA|nr:hypothetical protein [Rhodococcus artemisiae]MEE2062212.1 hypothetical protein [Rhodococcus artemisiae]